MNLIANCKPLGIGSLPDIDANLAWENVLKNFTQIPFWPQLPKRSYLENMYLQFSEQLPGRVVDLENERFFVDKTQDLEPDMEKFFNIYLSEDIEAFKISKEYSLGIHSGLELLENNKDIFNDIEFIKGQLTGPISFGLQVIDSSQKPILYDDMLHDILVKNLQRKAQWQEQILGKINKNTIISVDEPYLSSVGSGFLNLNRDMVIRDIEAVFQSIKNIKATHCCGNTDWSLIFETSTDIILFDAYNYTKNFVLFNSDIRSFLSRGGCIGWGIVPTSGTELEKCKVEELLARLEYGINLLVDKGIDHDTILHQSFITPACGLGPLSVAQAETAMNYTNAISEQMRTKYNLE